MVVTKEKPVQNPMNCQGNSVSTTNAVMLAGKFLLGCHIYIGSEVVSDIATTNSLVIKNRGAYFYNINI